MNALDGLDIPDNAPWNARALFRLLTRLADAVFRHRWWFFWPNVVLFPLAVWYSVAELKFNLDRSDLVGSDKKYHRNYLEFRKEFPGQDDLVAVVESDDAEKNRQFVERLGAKLEAETNLFTDVFYKGDLKMMGPKALLFLPELLAVSEGGDAALGIGYALGATLIAAIGNLITMRLQRDQVPVFTGPALGMAYGAITAALAAALVGTDWHFDGRTPYVASLLYLAVFGSIAAFGAYFLLLRKVGPGPASFVGVSTPVVAMLLTTLFEDYRWSSVAVAGVALAVAGNLIALGSTRRRGS